MHRVERRDSAEMIALSAAKCCTSCSLCPVYVSLAINSIWQTGNLQGPSPRHVRQISLDLADSTPCTTSPGPNIAPPAIHLGQLPPPHPRLGRSRDRSQRASQTCSTGCPRFGATSRGDKLRDRWFRGAGRTDHNAEGGGYRMVSSIENFLRKGNGVNSKAEVEERTEDLMVRCLRRLDANSLV